MHVQHVEVLISQSVSTSKYLIYLAFIRVECILKVMCSACYALSVSARALSYSEGRGLASGGHCQQEEDYGRFVCMTVCYVCTFVCMCDCYVFVCLYMCVCVQRLSLLCTIQSITLHCDECSVFNKLEYLCFVYTVTAYSSVVQECI